MPWSVIISCKAVNIYTAALSTTYRNGPESGGESPAVAFLLRFGVDLALGINVVAVLYKSRAQLVSLLVIETGSPNAWKSGKTF